MRSSRKKKSRSEYSRDGGNKKRKSTSSRERKNRNSKKRVKERRIGGKSNSFKGRFKEASKRSKRS